MDGEISAEFGIRRVYSTDASIYQQLPAAVAFPMSDKDIRLLIRFASECGTNLIPRAAGTSLAGQVVGNGVVVDVSKNMNNILEINREESWVKLQPGVVRDDLNHELAEHGLFFAPETSTSNRATIGGMLGNNSCGANSIVYGSTRDHVIEVSGFLSDGSHVTFGPTSRDRFTQLCNEDSGDLESSIYCHLDRELNSEAMGNAIRNNFPKPSIRRRNTGYAVDALLDSEPFGGSHVFNLAKLIAGSEGTLFFATEIKLNCLLLQETNRAVVCAHFESVVHAVQATQIAMQFEPTKCELIDKYVIEGARRNLGQAANLSFIVGAPEAVMLIEFSNQDGHLLDRQIANAIGALQKVGLGCEFPVVREPESKRVWQLRKAGLGVVSNCTGPKKPVTVIEDTAVDLSDLPGFVSEIDTLLAEMYHLSCVHYGHIGAGELHLRPNLDLNDDHDVKLLRALSVDVAKIVKKYRGSLSGEHGDGRLRSEHLELMIGKTCFDLLCRVKQTWDPNGIFNPGKITAAVRLDEDLKSPSSQNLLPIYPNEMFSFKEGGLSAAAGSCSGSGECRKSKLHGGTMCPSFMATRNEYDSTRARANMLRQVLQEAAEFSLIDEVGLEQAKDVLEMCLSCKGCKIECPSSVDMAKIKAEFSHQYYQRKRRPFVQRWLANFGKWATRTARFAPAINWALVNFVTGRLIKRLLGVHKRRSLPRLAAQSLRDWFEKRTPTPRSRPKMKTVFLFCDEFTNHIDVEIGKAAIELLERLGYEVEIPQHVESGRSAISVGMLEKAESFAEQNVEWLADLVSSEKPLIGIEPSAILTIRDEYVDLVSPEFQEPSRRLSANTFTIDEFLAEEIAIGNITRDQFVADSNQKVLLHLHCHQKALSQVSCTQTVLEFAGLNVELIPSGCCGMAGFFGYQADKYELSIQIGELVLFPVIRGAKNNATIAATGTSCRHQILDGTSRRAKHHVEILRNRIRER